MRIIPAIDIIDGKCVRLTKGDYSTQKIYSEDPWEVAKSFEDAGIQYLHLVDLDGAKSKHIVNYRVLEKLAGKTKLQIDFGGGIKTDEDIRIAFESGAKQITGGSVAVTNPARFLNWLAQFGRDSIILGADVQDRMIATHGWQQGSDYEILEFLENFSKKNISYVICTDISKDGMLSGPSFELYQEIIETFPQLKLIASGGVSTIDDLYRLGELGCDGAIIGKAIYEGKITLNQLEAFL